jgi:hypothetical protein
MWRGSALFRGKWLRGAKDQQGMFEDREKGQEARFAHDADKEFRITARRNKLLGLWAAERLGLTEAEAQAYARAVVQADFEEAGDEDVIRKLIGDLLKGGIDTSDIEIREMLSRKAAEAREQIEAGS